MWVGEGGGEVGETGRVGLVCHFFDYLGLGWGK